MSTREWGVFRIHVGDCREVLRTLPDASVHCCVTSPPYYGLRDYGHAGQIGLEQTPADYVEQMVAVFREVRRVLRDDGTLWLNLGDSYAAGRSYQVSDNKNPGAVATGLKSRARPPEGLKEKDLIGIPWRVAFALQADGWYLRQDIIWHKPNPMPESVRDRCTKSHEYVFLLSKSGRYYFDSAAMQEPAVGGTPGNRRKSDSTNASHVPCATPHGGLHVAGSEREPEFRNKRSVWTVPTRPFKGSHFATFPPALVEPCVLAGSPVGGVVLDPFGGAGTTGLVAAQNGRVGVLCELNPAYVDIAERRIATAVFGKSAFGEAA